MLQYQAPVSKSRHNANLYLRDWWPNHFGFLRIHAQTGDLIVFYGLRHLTDFVLQGLPFPQALAWIHELAVVFVRPVQLPFAHHHAESRSKASISPRFADQKATHRMKGKTSSEGCLLRLSLNAARSSTLTWACGTPRTFATAAAISACDT